MTKKLVLFASGAGSNVRNIITHFKGNAAIEIALVVSNKATAGVLDIADEHGVPKLIIDRASFYESEAVLEQLKAIAPDLIVLAGFLWKVPDNMIAAFPEKIVNVHPSLLPKFGGKGMYGHHVHEAVVAAKEKESGITIHYVNEVYDDGRIIKQAKCEVTPEDTPASLLEKIKVLEHDYFPTTLAEVLNH